VESFVTRISAEQRQANLALEAAHADERAADHQRAQELARMQKRGAGKPKHRINCSFMKLTAQTVKQCICCWFGMICA